jgi:predicted ArsR family transcriptional regulator
VTDQLALAYDDRMSGNYRNSDPVSSVAAARAVNAEAQRARIRAHLASHGPDYARNIGRVLKIPSGEVSSRLAAMEHRQEVRRLPEMGENDCGRPVLLWELDAYEVDVETGDFL